LLKKRVLSARFIPDVCSEMASDFGALLQEVLAEMRVQLTSSVKAIEEVVNRFQGNREKIELFKLYPAFGKEAEAALKAAKTAMDEVETLTQPVCAEAIERWPDLAPLLVDKTVTIADDGETDDPTQPPPSKRIKRETSSPEFAPGTQDEEDASDHDTSPGTSTYTEDETECSDPEAETDYSEPEDETDCIDSEDEADCIASEDETYYPPPKQLPQPRTRTSNRYRNGKKRSTAWHARLR
jgi:hypothetical protein